MILVVLRFSSGRNVLLLRILLLLLFFFCSFSKILFGFCRFRFMVLGDFFGSFAFPIGVQGGDDAQLASCWPVHSPLGFLGICNSWTV